MIHFSFYLDCLSKIRNMWIHYEFHAVKKNINFFINCIKIDPFINENCWRNYAFFSLILRLSQSNFLMYWYFLERNCDLNSVNLCFLKILSRLFMQWKNRDFFKCIKIDSFDAFEKSKHLIKHLKQRHQWPNPDIGNEP